MSAKKSTKNQHYSKEELGVLKSVNKRLSLLADYKHQFKSGLLRGIGFAIGASIIGAIVVTLILNFFETINVQFVNDIIDNVESSDTTN